MRAVWIVVGSTGAYEDREEWTVRAYPEAASAYAHARHANAWLRENRLHRTCHTGRIVRLMDVQNPWDLDCHADYTGSDYHVERVGFSTHLREHFPAYQ